MWSWLEVSSSWRGAPSTKLMSGVKEPESWRDVSGGPKSASAFMRIRNECSNMSCVMIPSPRTRVRDFRRRCQPSMDEMGDSTYHYVDIPLH